MIDERNKINEISSELLTVSKEDDSFADFVVRPLNRDFFSDEKSCALRRFIPLRTGTVRVVDVKLYHSKLFLAVRDNTCHIDVVVSCMADLKQ